jgi:hypothetical protein
VYKKECGWEVIYIGLVESVKYILEILWWGGGGARYESSRPMLMKGLVSVSGFGFSTLRAFDVKR